MTSFIRFSFWTLVVGFALLGSVDVRRKPAQRDRPELPSA